MWYSLATASPQRAASSPRDVRATAPSFLLGVLLLHHFHSIEAAVRECRLLLCCKNDENDEEGENQAKKSWEEGSALRPELSGSWV